MRDVTNACDITVLGGEAIVVLLKPLYFTVLR